MPNQIQTTLAGSANMVMEYWSSYALSILRANVVLARTVATDSDFAEAGWRGKTIHIPYAGRFTAVPKVEDTNVTPSTPSGGNGVDLTLDHHDVVAFSLEDFARAVSQPNIMERYLDSAAVALAELVEFNLWDEGVANFNLAAVGAWDTDIDASVLRAAKAALDAAKAPQSERYAVLSPKDHIAVLGDTDLQSYFAFSQAANSGGEVETGMVGRLYGFGVYMSQVNPLTDVNHQQNAAYHKNAIMLATRPFPAAPAGSGVMQSTATDAESGLSLRLSVQYDINAIATRCNLDILYGIETIRPDQGVLIQS